MSGPTGHRSRWERLSYLILGAVSGREARFGIRASPTTLLPTVTTTALAMWSSTLFVLSVAALCTIVGINAKETVQEAGRCHINCIHTIHLDQG